MSEMRDLLGDTAARIFSNRAARKGADGMRDLWGALVGAGFDRALEGEASGGAGLSWSDAFDLLFVAGAHATSVPLAEAMIGHWLLGRAELEAGGMLSIAPLVDANSVGLTRTDAGWRLDGALPRVPWGRDCDQVVTVCAAPSGPLLVLLDREAAGVALEQGSNLAGEPRDNLVLAGVTPRAVAAAPVDAAGLLAIAAIARSAAMAGAIGKALALSVEYANLREQFGRPIGKFQAIQQNIAVLATQAVAAKSAAEGGAEAIDDWLSGAGEAAGRSIAGPSAKIRAGEAAGIACAIAHQVFGAIGFTEEHELHRFTQRLWSWRDECGNEAYWSRVLGERVLASPVSAWRTVAPVMDAAARGGHA